MASSDLKAKRYQLQQTLGEGQYAVVYKASDTLTDRTVAVKKIKVGAQHEASEGIHRTAIREIKLLRELHHPHVIEIIDVYSRHNIMEHSIFMVFDYMEYDLEKIIKNKSIELDRAAIKGLALMLMQGLDYLHDNWIMHRDLKPNNLLVDKHGILRIADFGLGRLYPKPCEAMTSQVVTRWYRAPELLMAADKYGFGVDIWSAGCTIAEMLLRAPFLPGENDLDQLYKIFATFGVPNEKNWPGVSTLKGYCKFTANVDDRMSLQNVFKNCTNSELNLVVAMMTLNPNERACARNVLKMEYFKELPEPVTLCLNDDDDEDDY